MTSTFATRGGLTLARTVPQPLLLHHSHLIAESVLRASLLPRHVLLIYAARRLPTRLPDTRAVPQSLLQHHTKLTASTLIRHRPLHPRRLIGGGTTAHARSTRRTTSTATTSSSGQGIASTQARNTQDTDRYHEPLSVHLPYPLESPEPNTSCTKPVPPAAAHNAFALMQYVCQRRMMDKFSDRLGSH
jgi:hypothetical protein